MTKGEKLIQQLEEINKALQENNRLLEIFVGPITSLKSEQLAKASIEDQKAASKAACARAREKYGRGARK